MSGTQEKDMKDNNLPPRNAYLDALLSGTAPVLPPEVMQSETFTRDPAIRAQSLSQILSLVNCPFLIKPLRQRQSNLVKGSGSDYTLFYHHQVPDLSLPDPGDHVESLEIDVDMPEILARLRVVFNENGGYYQLDEAFIQAEGRHRKHFSCAAEDSKTLYPFLIKLSGVAGKMIAGKDIAGSEKAALRRLCDNTPQPRA